MAETSTASLTLRPNSYAAQDNGYLVYFEGECVGRIFRPGAGAPKDRPWFWGLDFHSWQGCTKPQYGNVETKEAAMTAFRVTWNSRPIHAKVSHGRQTKAG